MSMAGGSGNQGGSHDGAVQWVEQFGSAPLNAQHAGAIVEAVQGVMQAAVRATASLDWLEGDTYVQTLRAHEKQDQEAPHA
jgi:DNA-binding transcriptional regulator YdaS (Cro superfamily)